MIERYGNDAIEQFIFGRTPKEVVAKLKGELNAWIYKQGYDEHLTYGTLGKEAKGVVGGHYD